MAGKAGNTAIKHAHAFQAGGMLGKIMMEDNEKEGNLK